MTPIVKEVENSTAVSSPIASSNIAPKTNAEPAPRQQPVPLEMAVTVNGARTIEGTDKREPFSESTKTVLVFANGAVIRLASSVAPGQLLFVTNEKSKKEVVCQVVKSRNDGKSNGYVELEFTEPAVGFWGMRMPPETAGSASPVSPKAPVAPRSVAPSVPAPTAVLPPANVAPLAPAVSAPKIAVAPPPAPVAVKPSIPVVPAATQSIAQPYVSAITSSSTPTVIAPKPEVKEPEAAKMPAATVTATPPSKIEPKEDFESTVASPPASIPVVPIEKEISSEELKQQAARLQEQLNALLFREAAAEKAAAPAVTPAAEVKEQPAKSALGLKVLEMAEADLKSVVVPEVEKIIPPPPAPVEIKQTPIVSRKSSLSLPVEEVKIPAWLAPLARETESAASEAVSSSEVDPSVHVDGSDASSMSATAVEMEATSQKSEAVMFGGQLLGGASTTEASSSGSKKGLFLGIAATAVLFVGGGIWYGKQPGNFLAGTPSPSRASENNPAPAIDPSAQPAAATPVGGSNASASISAGSTPTSQLTQPKATSPAAPISKTATPVPAKTDGPVTRNATPTEEPKKPILGDFRLSTPNVSRSDDSSGGEAAPSIDSAQAKEAGDPLAGISSGHGSGPSAPLPIGGDVKPAHLVKATQPVYPPNARTQHISGDVKIDALIDASGIVTSTKVISGPTILHQSAMAAVKQWKYEPAQLDGKPTPMHLTVTVQFRLQ